MKTVSVFEGKSLQKSPPSDLATTKENSKLILFGNNGRKVNISDVLLSKHFMLVGGIGTGKSNTFYHIVNDLTRKLTNDDVMVIFDTKGDFLKRFRKYGDYVLSNDKHSGQLGSPNYWNIFNEIQNDEYLMENISEIANMVFATKLEKTSQIFFPQAAKDLFTAIFYHYMMNKSLLKSNNLMFRKFFESDDMDVQIIKIINKYPRFKTMSNYVYYVDANKTILSDQSQGILSELRQAVNEFFVGYFAKDGTISIRDIIKKKSKSVVFIEYDISLGNVLTPIYSLLFDLAIKEALGRKEENRGNVFFIVDEFKLLPHLKHIDDAVNFGRSLGLKFMIGIQNVDQIYENYGENQAKNIFSGFSNKIFFKVGDYSTRKYMTEYCGKNRKITEYKKDMVSQSNINEANVIEDWDISNLEVGEAIYCIDGNEPFLFKINYYGD